MRILPFDKYLEMYYTPQFEYDMSRNNPANIYHLYFVSTLPIHSLPFRDTIRDVDLILKS